MGVVHVQPGPVGQDHVGQPEVLVGELGRVGRLAGQVEPARVAQRVLLLEVPPRPARPGEGNGKTSALDAAAEAGVTAVDWIDERTSLSGAGRWLMFRKVPKGTNWFYTLGSATMFAFLNQAVTGVFLAMFYDPSPTRAYESARYITNEAFLGEFVRGMHKWGSSMMVILIFLHMGRVFFFGAYKYPRELNWIIGVLLLVMGMTEGFTGYLLPWDQTAYWATVVGMNITANGPFVGTILAQILQDGPAIGTDTLARFYSLHMLVAPGAIFALIGLHLYLVVRLGVTSPPWSKEAAGSEHVQPEPPRPARSGLITPTMRGRPTP